MVEIEWLKPEENLRIVDREQIISRLRSALSTRVESAYLFGSYARQDFRPDSDLDLIIVVKTDTSFPQRAALFEDLKTIFPRIDFFVYTPEEFETGLKEASFISDQSNSWIQLV